MIYQIWIKMSTNQINRKRNRSADADFHPQSKYFINQRIVNSLDQKYMKTIFGKYFPSKKNRQEPLIDVSNLMCR